ncbi:hypothetical protein MRX96_057926, partial [Rhipicephalus microplus]
GVRRLAVPDSQGQSELCFPQECGGRAVLAVHLPAGSSSSGTAIFTTAQRNGRSFSGPLLRRVSSPGEPLLPPAVPECDGRLPSNRL